jgi:hypothetical protein
MGFGEVIVAVMGIAATAGTLCCYLVMRADVAKRGVSDVGSGVQRALEELRTEIASLRRQEAEAVLSFDSTLQTLHARVKHLEQQALPPGAGRTTPLEARTARPASELAPEVVETR